jgi:hypothetical protein
MKVMADARQWCRIEIVRGDGTPLTAFGVGGGGRPDLAAVDTIAHLALLARRAGARMTLVDVSPELRSLVELAGLALEMEREAEGGEEALWVQEVEEEVHPRDSTA